MGSNRVAKAYINFHCLRMIRQAPITRPIHVGTLSSVSLIQAHQHGHFARYHAGIIPSHQRPTSICLFLSMSAASSRSIITVHRIKQHIQVHKFLPRSATSPYGHSQKALVPGRASYAAHNSPSSPSLSHMSTASLSPPISVDFQRPRLDSCRVAPVSRPVFYWAASRLS